MLENFVLITDKISLYNYAGLPAELLLWERMWKEKKDRREDIPDSIGATLEQIDKDAYVNIHTMLQILFLFHLHLVKGPSQPSEI